MVPVLVDRVAGASVGLQLDDVPLQMAQRLLGHSDPKLTAQIYTHVEVEDLRDAVATLPLGRGASMARPTEAPARTADVARAL